MKTEKQNYIKNAQELYNAWIQKAESDIHKVEVLIKAKEYDGALFFSQQAAEKALNAVHIKQGKGLLKTHELASLARKVKAPQNIVKLGKFLTPHESEARYPDKEGILFTKEAAEEALGEAKEIVSWCKEQ
ncbi:MAG: HEPN domain-containing protein [Patescibacteria group bacterium]|jgi:HEPN domain-containing protein